MTTTIAASIRGLSIRAATARRRNAVGTRGDGEGAGLISLNVLTGGPRPIARGPRSDPLAALLEAEAAAGLAVCVLAAVGIDPGKPGIPATTVSTLNTGRSIGAATARRIGSGGRRGSGEPRDRFDSVQAL